MGEELILAVVRKQAKAGEGDQRRIGVLGLMPLLRSDKGLEQLDDA